MFIFTVLVLGAIALCISWLYTAHKEEQSKQRIQNDTIHAMQERLILDGELLHVMKVLMQEADLHSGGGDSRSSNQGR